MQNMIEHSNHDIIIIDDLRLMCHVDFMRQNYSNIKIIRVNSNNENRESRGWVATSSTKVDISL